MPLLPLAILALTGCEGTPATDRPARIADPAPAIPTALAAGRTHVVLVIIDTLRADHLGAWGHTAATSPRIDALAADGVRFSRAFAASSWTRPGVAALTTGMYPRSVGIYEEHRDRLPDEITTMGELFAGAGYVTLGVNANPNVMANVGTAQGFDDWTDPVALFTRQQAAHPEVELIDGRTVTDAALDAVDRHADALADAPLYLQVLYLDPHFPYAPPAELRARVAAAGSAHPDYDGEILDADQQLGRLLDGLATRGLLHDTLVVVTSDHGEGLDSHAGQPAADEHGLYLYDSNVHIPLVFRHPALAKGHVSEDLVSQVDVLPTIAELLHLDTPAQVQGRSFAAAALGKPLAHPRTHVYAETEFRWADKAMVRTADQKLIVDHGVSRFRADGRFEGRAEQMDGRQRHALKHDPPEALYVGPPPAVETLETLHDAPETAARLRAELHHWGSEHERRPPEGRSKDDVDTLGDGTVVPSTSAQEEIRLDAETTRQLELLGYVE